MNHTQKFLLLALSATLTGLFPFPAHSAQRTFVVDEADHGNQVRFTSDAPVELIHGRTHKVKGTVSFDEKFSFDTKHPFVITFDVDLASIDTGIPLRNEHMRDRFLETEKYPRAVFKVTKMETKAKPPFKNGQVVNMKATGPFTLHGKTVVKTIPVAVTNRGDKVRIVSTFPISLQEHGIKRPEAVFQKLAETIYVTIDAMGAEKVEKAAQ